MAAVYPRQYVQVSVSISDCQKIFELNRYTPEQIIDCLFTTNKNKSMTKEQFMQSFKRAFEKNIAPENIEKANDAVARVFEVCAQGAPEITVDQLGKGIGVFTTRREINNQLRDFFFYLDKDFKSVIEENDIQSFLKEAANKGITKNISTEFTDLQKSIVSDKGRMELTYWILFVWRNHSAVKGLLEIYRELQSKKGSVSLSSSSVSDSQKGFVERGTPVELDGTAISRSEIIIRNDQEKGETEKTALRKKVDNQEESTPKVEHLPIFGGEQGILSRSTKKLTSFDEFLAVGESLKLHDMTAKEFMKHFNNYMIQLHGTRNGDITLHEFIRLCVDMFKSEDQDYYEFVNAIIQIFQFMDLNDNGMLDISEALQGILHLFGGTEEDKIAAAFMLFDADNSGFIEFGEVLNFVHSTISITGHRGEGYTKRDKQVLRDIAYATACNVFETMDIDHNAKVSLDEFLTWFRSTKGQLNPVEVEAAKTLKEEKLAKLHKDIEYYKALAEGKIKQPNEEEVLKKAIEETKADTFIIEELRKKIPFETVHIQQAVELLKTDFEQNVCNIVEFIKYLKKLVDVYQLPGKENVEEVAQKLFNALDTNRNSVLEISEIAVGLGLLCGGSQIEKIKAGFDLFDLNNDKVLSFQETVNFMGSFFKIITSDNPNEAIFNADSDHLAYSMAFTIFAECGLPLDGFLEFFTFKQWVKTLSI